MHSPNHPTTDIEDAFSSNFPDYTTTSPNYFPASPGNISPDPIDNLSKYLLASRAISPFHYMQAYNAVANKPPILPQDPITPPTILTPSLVLPPSLLFDPRYFFVLEELLPAKKQIHTPSSSSTMLSNSSRKQACILMPLKRTSTSKASAMTHAAIRKLVVDIIVIALEAQAATIASTNNLNRNFGPRKTHVARKCTYEKFMSCQPFYFNGTEGAVGLVHWFKRIESVFSCSKCAKKNKVKFAINTLIEEALFWWNSFAQPIRVKEAYKITLSEFKTLLIKKYCTQTEIKKMEEAITMTQKLIKQVMKHNSVQETNNHKRNLKDRRNTTNVNKNNYHNNNRSNDHHK
nr:reverse transcriptase domain-containing protein [Tanacetum cinerariifolium]